MSLIPAHRRASSLLPELTDWFPDFPQIMTMRPIFDSHVIKVEDELTEGKYIVRAELPGLDPAKDITVSVRDGLLTIKAERSEQVRAKGRSEFSYGSFTRAVGLPTGADEDAVQAGYDQGILTVTVPVAAPTAKEKQIEVKSGK